MSVGRVPPRASGPKRGRGAPRWRSLAALRPYLAAELHPTRNRGLDPQELGLGSTRVWWRCSSCGYEWRASIVHRASTEASGVRGRSSVPVGGRRGGGPDLGVQGSARVQQSWQASRPGGGGDRACRGRSSLDVGHPPSSLILHEGPSGATGLGAADTLGALFEARGLGGPGRPSPAGSTGAHSW
jgi:Probable Zinc-ribbon domain